MLALLPAPPPNWKLTFSMGKERLSYAYQLETLAMRKYLFVPPPPPPGTPPQPPSPPKEVTLTLIDTGCDPERIHPFDGFKVDTDPNGTHIMVQNCPTIQLISGETYLSIKISDRFILSTEFSNMKDTEIKIWEDKWLPLQKMINASNAAPKVATVSGLVSLPYVDEFKPSSNFASRVNFVNKADTAKAMRAPPH